MRHGQSQWNKENRFTGWVDVDLSPAGIAEAEKAGRLLRDVKFDFAFTSGLKRAAETLNIIIRESGQKGLKVTSDAALNERMYGELQGMNKDEARRQFGEEQVQIWRRSYDVAPPGGESLKDTADRVLPYFRKMIAPLLRQGKNVIVSAHGNSLRALIMDLEKLSGEEILKVEVPTGSPKSYVVDAGLNIISSNYLS